MAYFVLDFDETAIVMDDPSEKSPRVDEKSHHIWNRISTKLGRHVVTFGVLNPDLLLKTLEAASHTDGLIILTSGSWTKDVLTGIVDAIDESVEYDVSPFVRSMISKALFYSPETEALIGLQHNSSEDVEEIRVKSKNERLKKIIQFEGLENQQFVVLDDNISHIMSFNSMSNVTAIHATTNTNDKSFYQTVINALHASTHEAKPNTRTKKRQRPYSSDSMPVQKKQCTPLSQSVPLLNAKDNSHGEHILLDPDLSFTDWLDDDLSFTEFSNNNELFSDVLDGFSSTGPDGNISDQVSSEPSTGLLQSEAVDARVDSKEKRQAKIDAIIQKWPKSWHQNETQLSELKDIASALIFDGDVSIKVDLLCEYLHRANTTQYFRIKEMIESTDFPNKEAFHQQLITKLDKSPLVKLRQAIEKRIDLKAKNLAMVDDIVQKWPKSWHQNQTQLQELKKIAYYLVLDCELSVKVDLCSEYLYLNRANNTQYTRINQLIVYTDFPNKGIFSQQLAIKLNQRAMPALHDLTATNETHSSHSRVTNRTTNNDFFQPYKLPEDVYSKCAHYDSVEKNCP